MKLNALRYQALRNAPECLNRNHINVMLWNTGLVEGIKLSGSLLDDFIDKEIGSPIVNDSDRYLFLRNRGNMINEHITVTYWEYNPYDTVNNGTDIFGAVMDEKIDQVFGLNKLF